MYDHSDPEIFHSTIIEKTMNNNSEDETYNLVLAPRGPQKEIQEVSISEGFYNKIKKDDKVKIYFMK